MIRRPPRSTLFPSPPPFPSPTATPPPGPPTQATSAGAYTGRKCRGPGTQHQALFRSEEHTSELQSQSNLVCRLLLEKKKQLNGAASTSSASLCKLQPKR